jgi:hypothetical protein
MAGLLPLTVSKLVTLEQSRLYTVLRVSINP